MKFNFLEVREQDLAVIKKLLIGLKIGLLSSCELGARNFSDKLRFWETQIKRDHLVHLKLDY